MYSTDYLNLFWRKVDIPDDRSDLDTCWIFHGTMYHLNWHRLEEISGSVYKEQIERARTIVHEVILGRRLTNLIPFPTCDNPQCISPHHSKIVPHVGGIISAKAVFNFWNLVDKSPGYGPWGNCWRWLSVKNKEGYGLYSFRDFSKEGRVRITRGSNRVSFLIEHGYFPELDVCHSCDVPDCTNNSHLWEGTKKENMADRDSKGRNGYSSRLTCKRGHIFPENTPRTALGARICVTCKNISRRQNRERERLRQIFRDGY